MVPLQTIVDISRIKLYNTIIGAIASICKGKRAERMVKKGGSYYEVLFIPQKLSALSPGSIDAIGSPHGV